MSNELSLALISLIETAIKYGGTIAIAILINKALEKLKRFDLNFKCRDS